MTVIAGLRWVAVLVGHLLVAALTVLALGATTLGYLMQPSGYSDVNLADGAWWWSLTGVFFAGNAMVLGRMVVKRPVRVWLLWGLCAVIAIALMRMVYVDLHYAQHTPDQG